MLTHTDHTSPTVAYEPCGTFQAAVDHDEPFCAACGHLSQDHAIEAIVTWLPERALPGTALPARRAS